VRKTWALVAQTSGTRAYWVLAAMMTTIITARFLGPNGRGVYVAAVGWVTLFSTFGHLSLSQVIIYLVAGKPAGEWLAPVLGSMLAIIGVIVFLGWLIAAVLYFTTGGRMFHNLDASVLILAFAALPTLIWIEEGYGFLIALDRLPLANVAQVTGATTSMVLTFIALAGLHTGVHGALGAMLIAQCVSVAIILGHLLRRVDVLRVDAATVRKLLRAGASLHLNAIGTYLFTQANILILNYYRPPREIAWYQVAQQVVLGLQVIPLAVSSVTYTLVSKEGADAAWPQQRHLLVAVSIGMVAVIAAGWLLAPIAVPLLFGAAFRPAAGVLRILLLGIIGTTMSLIMASQWISRGLLLQAALFTVGCGAITVAVNLFVVPRYGMAGAAWATVGVSMLYIAVNLGMALWIERRLRVVAAN
jgi:O-antigen/teichoic acid export membrane protein